jgi:hypothetical protein
MTTEITILGEEEEVDVRKAAINGIKVTKVDSKTLVQTHAITDTGADTNCTDKKLRGVIGRDKLPDAAVGLQGCTGTNNDKMKDKLRLVTKDKEITVMEARSIKELGYSGPNTREFLECVKTELDVNKRNSKHFDFNTEGATPRVLVGLKSGNLLANQLSESERIKMEIDKPFLSPNLQVWSTPLNSKLLITGSLGVDPKLVELKSNYPRFELIVKEEEKEEEILERLRTKVRKIEEILGEKCEENTNKVLVSIPADVLDTIDKSASDPNTESSPNDHEQGKIMFTSIAEKSLGKVTEKQTPGSKSRAANEGVKAGEGNSSHETEKECDECSDAVQNCPPPRLWISNVPLTGYS